MHPSTGARSPQRKTARAPSTAWTRRTARRSRQRSLQSASLRDQPSGARGASSPPHRSVRQPAEIANAAPRATRTGLGLLLLLQNHALSSAHGVRAGLRASVPRSLVRHRSSSHQHSNSAKDIIRVLANAPSDSVRRYGVRGRMHDSRSRTQCGQQERGRKRASRLASEGCCNSRAVSSTSLTKAETLVTCSDAGNLNVTLGALALCLVET